MRTNLALFAFLALTGVACGSDSTDSSSTDLCAGSGAAVTVTAADYTFTPDSITITAGQSVCWQNTGHLNHTVIDAGGRFPTADLPAGQTFVFTFLSPQPWFGLRCGIHSTMTGAIVVNP